jgi:serine beta-lactamase-like protein LACTB, mitochondrial
MMALGIQLKAKTLIQSHQASLNIPGISVAAVVNGQLAWTEAMGLADVENKVPATEDTVFRLASISKALTATTAMTLVENGKLDLDRPVRQYAKSWPEKKWPVTTRQLLGHLGGVRHY